MRLTVGGKTYTQPLSLVLDPRVTTPAADLARAAELSREMYDGAVAAHTAYEQARALVKALDAAGGQDAAAFKAQVEAVAPAPRPQPAGFFRRAAPSGPPTLNGASDELMGAAMSMQEADVAPTARQVDACKEARTRSDDVMGRWRQLAASGLDQLNAKRAAAGLQPIRMR